MVNRRKFFQIAGSTALAMSPVTRMLCKTDERAVRQNFNLPDYYPIEESIEDEDFGTRYVWLTRFSQTL